ncbi:Xaa-Pro peptidase family protein [Oceanobacillus luteolus]|uniref:M24 family metallopeptidase n=1 Tax=Oceanobacillus luteolus TaxID=1274358 RepID=A0ABW4HR06_9BACI|nr:Xaa-Pro peptidase family protein [Oceanobacillus luteolus]MCM3741874.1 Xaa-Pro peptidase family protein [Oceanobacillus luteolus]
MENQNRLNALQNYLQKENIELAMITDPTNVFYYTGFLSEPHERFLALVRDGKSDQWILFVPALDKDMAAESSIIENIIPISDEQNPFEVLQQHTSSGVVKVGLEKKAVNVFRYEAFQQIFPEAAFTDVQPFIDSARKKKSRSEVEKMQLAIDIIEKVLEEGIKKVKVGMTESELVGELELLMRKFGADGPSFSTIVLAGEKSALPHGTPGDRTINHGDFLLIDFGVIKDGYCSDITRTFVIGEASEKQKEIYNIVLQSTNTGIDAVQAGVPLKNFDIPARKVIQDSGYGEYFNNRIGHGLGMNVHEEPSVHEKNEDIAEPGLLFTIEPGIYIPGFGGVRIEDNVYINEDGKAEVLTSFPKKLMIL